MVLIALMAAFFFAIGFSNPVAAQVNVLTQHNDNSRTGANLNEALLNTSNVNVNQFGKLFTCAVDGYVYAQPLYVSGLSIGGAVHNVVYICTEHNSVYAFDADTGVLLWHTTATALGSSVPSTVFGAEFHDLVPEIGITGTPVIDPSTNAIYLVVFTQSKGNYYQYLHALSLTTGKDLAGSPVNITATVGSVTFDPFQHLQRPGLLLSNNILYICFGSHADMEPYHGWMFAYNEQNLSQQAVFCATPDGEEGAIWMSGQGPVADSAGNIYVMTGNSDEKYENNTADYGESFVKLGLSGHTLSELDYFKPNNYDNLNANDTDLGSAGPLLLPGTNDLVGGGKQGVLYLVNTADMGELNLSQDQAVQEFQATDPIIFGSPVYWNSPVSGPTIYVWAAFGDYLKAYNMTNGLFNTTPYSENQIASPGEPGGDLSVSSEGSTAGTGIVWAYHSYNQSAQRVAAEGELDAYDATNLTTPLWTSRQNLSRDDTGNVAKFNPATIANGKVFVPTFSGQLDVYGLLPPTYPAGLQMISSPYDYSAESVSQLFGSAKTVIVQWDTAAGQYAVSPNAPADHMRLGQGYWVRLGQATKPAGGGPSADPTQNFSLSLPAGWSQIGDPFFVSVPVSSLEFSQNGQTLSFADATSGETPLINPNLYDYDQTSSSYQPITAGQSLASGSGYWIETSSPVTVIFPAPE